MLWLRLNKEARQKENNNKQFIDLIGIYILNKIDLPQLKVVSINSLESIITQD